MPREMAAEQAAAAAGAPHAETDATLAPLSVRDLYREYLAADRAGAAARRTPAEHAAMLRYFRVCGHARRRTPAEALAFEIARHAEATLSGTLDLDLIEAAVELLRERH